jgi:hypothetical protein
MAREVGVAVGIVVGLVGLGVGFGGIELQERVRLITESPPAQSL